MRLFSSCYQFIQRHVAHPKAPLYLYGLSFAESSFFPIPPDVMLIPLLLAKPNNAFRYAFYTTLSSVLGAFLGYAIGFFCLSFLWPYLQQWGYAPLFIKAQHYFSAYGVWVFFIAGIGPVPYKIFTITGGALQCALLPFLIGSFCGRGARFFLEAAILRLKGVEAEKYLLAFLHRLDCLGMGTFLLGGVVCVIYYCIKK